MIINATPITPPTTPPAIAPIFSLDDLVGGRDVGGDATAEGDVELVANTEDVDTGAAVETKNFSCRLQTPKNQAFIHSRISHKGKSLPVGIGDKGWYSLGTSFAQPTALSGLSVQNPVCPLRQQK